MGGKNMSQTEKERRKQTEEWLDERWNIFQMENRSEDLIFYNGAMKACDFLGYGCYRDENGKHTLIK
jgi:hypothetical protein